MRDPETYWQARAVTTENILTALIARVHEISPPAMQEDLEQMIDAWDKALETLEVWNE